MLFQFPADVPANPPCPILMSDHREGLDPISSHEDIDLHEVIRLVSEELIIHAGIAA